MHTLFEAPDSLILYLISIGLEGTYPCASWVRHSNVRLNVRLDSNTASQLGYFGPHGMPWTRYWRVSSTLANNHFPTRMFVALGLVASPSDFVPSISPRCPVQDSAGACDHATDCGLPVPIYTSLIVQSLCRPCRGVKGT